MKKKIIIGVLATMILSISSCATFNINEAAAFSHKCPSKHAKRIHTFQGKIYFN